LQATASQIPDLPASDAEVLLAHIWCDVLGLSRVGIHDNFFDLGGHSLMITRVLARLRESLRIDLPMKVIFEAPTIAGFALLVENAMAEQLNGLTDEELQRLKEETGESLPG
jgi:acyl carrier protein